MLQKLNLGASIGSPQAVAKLWAKSHMGKERHSVVGRGINAKDGLEFVVYYGQQCYIEHLFYYRRTISTNPGYREQFDDESR